jgi:8-oxo-dGTP pyrophosphatase MutT (NUDIX family)
VLTLSAVNRSVAIRRLGYRSAWTLLSVYRFVRRPGLTGVKCVLTDADCVLLVRHTYGPRDWDLPGGGLKRGEAPAAAARREMREELGLTIQDWTALGDVPQTVHRCKGTLHCFQVEVRRPEITIDRGELSVARWFARNELPSSLRPDVRPILARLAS